MSQLNNLIQKVDQAPSARDAMLLCQDRWMKNYHIQTGKKDGEARFQSELLNLLDIAADKPAMLKAAKFEWFKAMMKISRTGLSLASEGHLYVEVYEESDKDRRPTGVFKIKITKGNHGKREMLRQMKVIKDVSAGHVVMTGDDFQYDELNRKVLKHVKTPKSSNKNSLDDVIGAYVRVEHNDGRIVDVYLMHAEIVQAKKKSRNKREDSTWNEWPLEMAKKVVYGRAYKELYRDPEGLEMVGSDDEDEEQETHDTSYTIQEEPAAQVAEHVDESTGEVVESAQEAEPQQKRQSRAQDVDSFI